MEKSVISLEKLKAENNSEKDRVLHTVKELKL